MPVCIVKKLNGQDNLYLINGKPAIFQTKFDAKKFLANKGVYCMVGYSFPEVELKEEQSNVEQEPVA